MESSFGQLSALLTVPSLFDCEGSVGLFEPMTPRLRPLEIDEETLRLISDFVLERDTCESDKAVEHELSRKTRRIHKEKKRLRRGSHPTQADESARVS